MRLRSSFVGASIVATAVVAAHGQEPPHMITFSSPANIEFMSDPIALDSEAVAGAPYSATAVTLIVQPLADGNRIVRESTAQISRDAKGRTRREQGMAMFGPVVNVPGAGDMRSVQISDPESGTMIMLDLGTRTAHKMPGPRVMVANRGVAVGSGVSVEKFEMAVPAPHPGGHAGNMIFSRRAAVAGMQVNEPVVEQLGTQFMEGVTVEGVRTTVTIPAGQIGNEQPIHIVSERWTSPDLKVLVMSRQSDPRFGETTYRLTNLSRVDPAPELFEIPADFTVVDAEKGRRMIIEKRLIEK